MGRGRWNTGKLEKVGEHSLNILGSVKSGQKYFSMGAQAPMLPIPYGGYLIYMNSPNSLLSTS